ncbi:MAG: hypothetical protein CL916_15375, partial [Deltaproteobacteria bacterium]|nr:hypothetical protein [Deltaproteobacteria bacterium]
MSKEKLPTYTDPQWVEDLLESVEKRVSALQDRAMKHTVLVEMLEVLTPEELVDFLSLLCSRFFVCVLGTCVCGVCGVCGVSDVWCMVCVCLLC